MEEIKLSLGSGNIDFGEEWTHIDTTPYPHVKYPDITNLSQFRDDSVDLIYASHVLEYFEREEVIDVLKEWFRVLKKGGVIRLAVPDFRIISMLYLEEDVPLFHFLGPLYGKMESGDKTIYHKTCYDYYSLGDLLKFIGFSRIKQYDWRLVNPHDKIDDQSQAYYPHMDKEKGILISLNVEATK